MPFVPPLCQKERSRATINALSLCSSSPARAPSDLVKWNRCSSLSVFSFFFDLLLGLCVACGRRRVGDDGDDGSEWTFCLYALVFVSLSLQPVCCIFIIHDILYFVRIWEWKGEYLHTSLRTFQFHVEDLSFPAKVTRSTVVSSAVAVARTPINKSSFESIVIDLILFFSNKKNKKCEIFNCVLGDLWWSCQLFSNIFSRSSLTCRSEDRILCDVCENRERLSRRRTVKFCEGGEHIALIVILSL